MKLTALEIKQQKFKKSLRGYDPAEVQSFLTLMSNEWEHLIAHNRELEEKIDDLREKIKHYERVEEALHETLQAAKETSDNKVLDAQKEAEHTIEKAEMEADSIVREAVQKRQQVRQSILRLLDRRNEIIGGIRSYLNVAHESIDRFAEDEFDTFETPRGNQEIAPSSNAKKKNNFSDNKSEGDAAIAPGTENIDDLVDDLD